MYQVSTLSFLPQSVSFNAELSTAGVIGGRGLMDAFCGKD